jgi:hypothetical protein
MVRSARAQCDIPQQRLLTRTSLNSSLDNDRTIWVRFPVCMQHFFFSTTSRQFCNVPSLPMSHGSSVGIATRCGPDDREVGVRVPVGSKSFTSRYQPDRFLDPPNLLVAAAVARGQFEHSGKGSSTVGSRYPKAGKGQQTENTQCMHSELQTDSVK